MFERPLLLWLLALAPLVAAPGILAIRNGRIAAGAGAMVLRLLAFMVLVLALAGFQVRKVISARHVETVAVLDQSRSIAPDQRQWIDSRVRELAGAMSPEDRFAALGFGRNVRLLSAPGDPRLTALASVSADGGATDIASALTAALGLFSADADKRIVLLSDGNQTVGDAARQIPALKENGARVYADIPPPSSTRRLALTAFSAPAAVRADQRFSFHLEIESEAAEPAPIKLDLLADSVAIGSQSVTVKPGLNRFELPYKMEATGAFVMGARVHAPEPLTVINAEAESPVTVKPPPRVLVVATSPPESLVSALKVRSYQTDIAPPRGLPERAEAYLPYQAVIIADASAATLSAGAATALNRYVAEYGGGLVATGETLRDERFAGSALEKTLPINFKPQPPPPSREPIAVYLCIDRSNSMSYDSRYPAVRDGERIKYAKSAAIALLRQLDDTDFAGVIAFDSQPYVLSHLGPLGDDRNEVENRIERLEPGGGTDFKEALEIAEREILSSQIPVRQVFLLTDGDTNRQYHDHDSLIAEFARNRIPVSTIRIGPDLANLRLLQDFAQATGGTFYRVQDIEKLPLLLVGLTREAMNRRKQGRSVIEPGQPSAILTGIKPGEIPPIDYFAFTSPKDGAQVPLRITRQDNAAPLLAAWQYGLGRAVAFTADPDSLATLSWIRWNRYAEFWSQLVSWVMRQGDSGLFTLRVSPGRDGAFTVEAEKADTAPIADLVLRVTGTGRAMDIAMTQIDASLYRGELGPLPRGKYSGTLMIKHGDTEKVLVQRDFASAGSVPADSDELKIRPPDTILLGQLSQSTGGAIGAEAADIVKPTGTRVTVWRSATPILLPFALMLFLGEVFVRRRFLGD